MVSQHLSRHVTSRQGFKWLAPSPADAFLQTPRGMGLIKGLQGKFDWQLAQMPIARQATHALLVNYCPPAFWELITATMLLIFNPNV